MTSSTSRKVLLSLSMVVMMVAVTSANWREWFEEERDPAYAWSPSLRSGYCAKTRQACSQTVSCCSHNDICVTHGRETAEGELIRTSTCRNIRAELWSFQPQKDEGTPCTDSRECKDLCCREYRGHRYGKIRLCGAPEDEVMTYTCIAQEL